MKNIIITGHNSGIGKSICELLEKNNYNIIKIKSRLENFVSLEKEVRNIIKKNDIDILINCAGIGVFEPHEQLNIKSIKNLIDINLTAPIILSNLCLRSLRKKSGHIINITSIEATRHSKFSALYTSTKSGLRDFSLCLFEEVRKSGIKVTSVNPDITKTPFFDKLKFKPSQEDNTYILPDELALVIFDIINNKNVVTDITIRPQKFALG